MARRSSPGCVDQRPAAWVGAQCLEVDHEATGLGSSRGSTRGVCLHLGQTEIAGQREVDTPGEDQLPSSGPQFWKYSVFPIYPPEAQDDCSIP